MEKVLFLLAKSIQEAEEPEGNFAAKSDFDVTLYDKTVRNVLYLIEVLAFAADFKEKVLKPSFLIVLVVLKPLHYIIFRFFW